MTISSVMQKTKIHGCPNCFRVEKKQRPAIPIQTMIREAIGLPVISLRGISMELGNIQVTGPTGKSFDPVEVAIGGKFQKFQELDKDGRIWWGDDRGNMPRLKRFLTEVKDGVVPQTLLLHTLVGNTQEAKKE